MNVRKMLENISVPFVFMKKSRRESGTAERKKIKWRLVLYIVYIVAFSTVALAFMGALLFLDFSTHLPDFQPLKEQQTDAYSIVYSQDNEIVGKLLPWNRISVSYERIPKLLIRAFIASEDSNFFEHRGVDYRRVARSIFKNLMVGRFGLGGSTITQQVARNFFLTPRRSLVRKLKEWAYSFGLERSLTKEEILSLYLNNIYLGNEAYGVGAAADSYFNKRIEQLNLAEMSMIAGLVKSPSRDSPVNNLKRAKDRQAYVLTRMTELQFITEQQKEQALKAPLKIQSRESAYFSKVPYFTKFIRQQVERKYGKEKLYQEGLRIYTTLDLSFQRTAQRAVEWGLRELDKRQGFRGPLRTLSPKEIRDLDKKKAVLNPLSQNEIFEGVILSRDDSKNVYNVWVEGQKGILPFFRMTWALHLNPSSPIAPTNAKSPSDLLKPGDVIHVSVKEFQRKDQIFLLTLEQEPLAQGALLCIEPETGYVKAMVGGRDFSESQFNRAIYSRRQPGSAFNPLIYAAALEKGYTQSTILMDSPAKYQGYDGGAYWAPKNYDQQFMGPITFRNALAHSRNVVTVTILEDIGLDYALRYFKKLGVESPVERDLSIATGTSEVSMLELVSGFGIFANKGERVIPIFIKKIVTMKGEIIEENLPPNEIEKKEEEEPAAPPSSSILKKRVISAQNAFIMTNLLEGVVQHGTGQGAKTMGRPVAGKTGTTNDYADSWFVGFTPSLLTGVWVGFDDKISLGQNETGARAALPIWVSFMAQALRNTPAEEFKVPEGVSLVRVNLETGLPDNGSSQETVMEAFIDGTVPEDKAGRADAPSSGTSVGEAARKETPGP